MSLYNGLGSALVTFTGSGDFTLTAGVDDLKATALLTDWSSRPITAVSGTLDSSATWSGIYHVAGGDFTIKDGVTLTLEPGTMVLIDGVKSGTDGTDIQIEGSIQALGTAASPITITAFVPGENWGELRFVNAEPSTFSYTNIAQAGHSPRVGHSNSGPAIRAQGSQITFDHVSFTDNAGKVMHATSGCDLVFQHCLLARSVMGPEIASTGLLFEDGWITEMHNKDDADAIYIHSQQAGQKCILSRGVIADMHDDGIDTLGSKVMVQDFIIRGCRDKGVSVYNGETTLDHCLIVENNTAPEDPTIATIAAKATEGATTIVNIDHSTIVASRVAGYTDIGIQSHNKYGVKTGTIVYYVTNSIIDATDAVDVQSPYLESDIHIDYSDVTSEAWPGRGNLRADPLFVDVQNHDYRLQPNSPVRRQSQRRRRPGLFRGGCADAGPGRADARYDLDGPRRSVSHHGRVYGPGGHLADDPAGHVGVLRAECTDGHSGPACRRGQRECPDPIHAHAGQPGHVDRPAIQWLGRREPH